jgi:hypothetical protein
LSSIIGANGFLIKGESGNVWSNHLVSSAGDVNGDGLDDLIISAHDDKSTKPPVPVTISDKLIAVLSCLPNTTYDLP